MYHEVAIYRHAKDGQQISLLQIPGSRQFIVTKGPTEYNFLCEQDARQFAERLSGQAPVQEALEPQLQTVSGSIPATLGARAPRPTVQPTTTFRPPAPGSNVMQAPLMTRPYLQMAKPTRRVSGLIDMA